MKNVSYSEYEAILIHTCDAYGFGEEDTAAEIVPIGHKPEVFGLQVNDAKKVWTAERLKDALECIKELNDHEMVVTK